MADLAEVMDLLDLAMARADGIVPDPIFDDMVDVGKRIRTRNGFVGEVLAVALAGGTGSGKSSIVNALVGEDIVTTGIVRPTTQSATAVYPEDAWVDLSPLLDSLGVEERIAHDTLESLVIVDLPDFDSTAEAHRHVVEDVLPRVDVVVWVLDPEKYADPVLHDEFLTPLAAYEGQFLFVMNQVDRLGEESGDAMQALADLLESDGFTEPVPVAIAASPRDGDADTEALQTVLAEQTDLKRAAIAKMALDVRVLASSGWSACHGIDTKDLGTESLDTLALSAATFVSLGVAAHELHHRVAAD